MLQAELHHYVNEFRPYFSLIILRYLFSGYFTSDTISFFEGDPCLEDRYESLPGLHFQRFSLHSLSFYNHYSVYIYNS